MMRASYTSRANRQLGAIFLPGKFQGLFVGHCVKHKTNIASARMANNYRPPSSGSQQSYTGGCRNRNESTSKTIPHTPHPCHQRIPMAIKLNATINEISLCFLLASVYRMCPPSSCQQGSRFSAVANNPTQAA